MAPTFEFDLNEGFTGTVSVTNYLKTPQNHVYLQTSASDFEKIKAGDTSTAKLFQNTVLPSTTENLSLSINL